MLWNTSGRHRSPPRFRDITEKIPRNLLKISKKSPDTSSPLTPTPNTNPTSLEFSLLHYSIIVQELSILHLVQPTALVRCRTRFLILMINVSFPMHKCTITLNKNHIFNPPLVSNLHEITFMNEDYIWFLIWYSVCQEKNFGIAT